MNVGAHVEFVKRASAWNRWQARRPNSPHREWHYSDPGLAIEGVDRKLCRNYRMEYFRINRPVYEQELAPVLAHQARAGGSPPNASRSIEGSEVNGRSRG